MNLQQRIEAARERCAELYIETQLRKQAKEKAESLEADACLELEQLLEQAKQEKLD